jgi:ATP adenylyltransferase
LSSRGQGCADAPVKIDRAVESAILTAPMEKIWAPWRIRYVLEKKSSQCIFCAKASQKNEQGLESNDEQNHVLLRGKSCFTLLNSFPYNPGHLMVVPYQHVPELTDLSRDVLTEMMETACRCQKILQRAIKAQGFNMGLNLGRVAGEGILEHLHLHIVPRWEGDTNFMPILADTRVLSEGLAEVYAKLLKAL